MWENLACLSVVKIAPLSTLKHFTQILDLWNGCWMSVWGSLIAVSSLCYPLVKFGLCSLLICELVTHTATEHTLTWSSGQLAVVVPGEQ